MECHFTPSLSRSAGTVFAEVVPCTFSTNNCFGFCAIDISELHIQMTNRKHSLFMFIVFIACFFSRPKLLIFSVLLASGVGFLFVGL